MNEAELFKFMEDCYYQYKEGTLAQEHYDQMESVAPNQVEHVESELGINKEDDISEEEQKMFKFMEDCYYQYKEGTLPQEHYDQMESVAPNWVEHVESELGLNKE